MANQERKTSGRKPGQRLISRSLVVFVLDILVVWAAFFFALWARFDFSINLIPKVYLETYVFIIPIWCVVTVVVFAIFKLYRSVWTYVSIDEAFKVMLAYLVLVGLFFVSKLVLKIHMPRSFYAIGIVLAFGMHIGVRFSYRLLRFLVHRMNRSGFKRAGNVENVMIIGGGAAGSVIIRELKNDMHQNLKPVCIIDDNPNKNGKLLYGVQIVGGRESIVEKVAEYDIGTIIFAIPTASAGDRKSILNICKETGAKLRTLPGVYQLTNGEVSVSRLKDVELTDLLGREPIAIDNEEVFHMITGKTILVTGGGGSIGSELCRQIAAHNPKQLIIFDIYENNAYEIQQELIRKYHNDLNLVTLIGSVRNTHRIESVMEQYKPDIVFHAAAHKHVPLMETSPNEASKNNVMGTY